MSDNTLHIRIKEQYAASLIEHLKKEHAIEVIEDDSPEIPEWQKQAVRETLSNVMQNPGHLQSWNLIKQKYKRQ